MIRSALALALLVAAPLAAAEPPLNVLFVISDDLNNDLSVYGHPLVRTPNLERLAARGVRFDRAYCQYPVCNPSRASLMTGLYPDQTGVLENSDNFRRHIPEVTTLPQLFRQSGYYAARVGKIYHYGVPTQIGTDGVDDPASWDERVNPAGRDKFDEYLIESIAPHRSFGGTLSWLAADGRDGEQTDGIGAAAAIALLEKLEDRPFFLAMGFYRPHTPYVAPRSYFAQYPLALVRPPVEPADDLLDIPAAAWVQRPYQDEMGEAAKREAMRAYYAAISFVDAQLGKILDALDRLGLAERTIVVFTSDHGYHMGEHRLWQKTTLFENSARVPLLIAAPGFESSRGKSTGAVAELLDVYPTLADLCGLEPPPHLVGRSLKPQLVDVNAPGKTAALTTYVTRDRLHPGAPHRPTEQSYSVRTERWRYTEWGARGWQGVELYDHLHDPREFRNLAHDPDYAGEVRRMRDLLATRKAAAGQAAAIPEAADATR